MRYLLCVPLLAVLLAGCNPAGSGQADAPATPEAQAKALEDSVLASHERLMSKADQVVSLAAQLQARPQPPRALLARIQSADQAMMTWMHQYQAPDSAAPAPQRLAYLQDQRRQLATLETDLGTALDSARATLRRPVPVVPTPAKTPMRK